ncbi:hypothetical protein [Shinella sp.]|uniref:hypothetical protein n=1 Tax=Shinella sp. TaxID=1870904 RepID=UPI003D29D4F7
MEERAKICVNSTTLVSSLIERMAQINDFNYKIGDGENGAEKDEILCSPELASLLEDMFCS